MTRGKFDLMLQDSDSKIISFQKDSVNGLNKAEKWFTVKEF